MCTVIAQCKCNGDLTKLFELTLLNIAALDVRSYEWLAVHGTAAALDAPAALARSTRLDDPASRQHQPAQQVFHKEARQGWLHATHARSRQTNSAPMMSSPRFRNSVSMSITGGEPAHKQHRQSPPLGTAAPAPRLAPSSAHTAHKPAHIN